MVKHHHDGLRTNEWLQRFDNEDDEDDEDDVMRRDNHILSLESNCAFVCVSVKSYHRNDLRIDARQTLYNRFFDRHDQVVVVVHVVLSLCFL